MNEYGLKEGIILTEDENEEFVYEKKKIKILPVWYWALDRD